MQRIAAISTKIVVIRQQLLLLSRSFIIFLFVLPILCALSSIPSSRSSKRTYCYLSSLLIPLLPSLMFLTVLIRSSSAASWSCYCCFLRSASCFADKLLVLCFYLNVCWPVNEAISYDAFFWKKLSYVRLSEFLSPTNFWYWPLRR